jgi:hypothetical protein
MYSPPNVFIYRSIYLVYSQIMMNHQINIKYEQLNALGVATCHTTFPRILLNTERCWMRDISFCEVRVFGLKLVYEKTDI